MCAKRTRQQVDVGKVVAQHTFQILMSQRRYLPDCDEMQRVVIFLVTGELVLRRKICCRGLRSSRLNTLLQPMSSKKGFGLQKLSINSMGFFNFLMGRTGKRKDGYFYGRYAANEIGVKR